MTAYHSCLMAKYWFEELTSLDVNVDIASEFRYRKIDLKKILYVSLYHNLEKLQILMHPDLCNQIKNENLCCGICYCKFHCERSLEFVLPIHCGTGIGVASIPKPL